MRFFGILGIVTLLGIAFLLSNNRKAIKLRILLWGTGLQILFASIILSESYLSWTGMTVFAALITFYIFREQLTSRKNRIEKVLFCLVLLALLTTATAVFYFLDSLKITLIFFVMSLSSLVLLKLIKKVRYSDYLTIAAMAAGLGMAVKRGVYGRHIFAALADQVDKFLKLTDAGSFFLFGRLADPQYFDQFGYQFAFSVLPTIIFFSAIMSILYYLGVMQAVVNMMAKFMRWTLGTSGAETLSVSANIFVGQTEAPLLIKPFLDDMTASELHAVMVGGFATIAGSVLAGYIRMGIDAGHLIAASVMSAPAALVFAKMILPEVHHSKTAGDVEIPEVGRADNLLDATARGVTDGLRLAVNVGAMLLAFIALVALVDVIFGFFDRLIDGKILGGALDEITGEYTGFFPGSLKTLFGSIFSPIAFLMGVPWKEAMDVGNLLGIKIAVNEFVGYAELSKYIQGNTISDRSITIATYALCGFANFGSIGIQLGGIGALAPKRRSDLSRVALRAMFGGALASWMTAAIAGILLSR